MISRPGLVGELASSDATLWCVEAGAGFGKTVLLDQLRQHLLHSLIVVRRPVGEPDVAAFLNELVGASRRAGHPETGEALMAAGDDPVATARALIDADRSLAVDDADDWGEAIARFIVELGDAGRGELRVVVCGRLMVGPLNGERAGWKTLRTADLAFNIEEVEDLLVAADLDGDLAPMLHDVSNGWPLAVSSVLARMSSAADPVEVAQALGRQEQLVDGLMSSYLDDLDTADLDTASSLARLPFFDPVIADGLGSPGVTERLLKAGVPITRRLDGWSEIAGQFRAALARRPGVDVHIATIADRFVERGEIQSAIDVCLTVGDRPAAARIIAALSTDQQTLLEPSAVNAAITTIADEVASAPRCLLVQAEVNGSYGRMPEGMAALERAVQVFGDADPGLTDPDHIETRLVLALWQIVSGQYEEGESQLQACEPALSAADIPRLNARAHDVRGVLAQLEGTDEALETASREYTQSLAIWRSLGETRPAAVTSFRLASDLLADMGRRTEALELLDSLPSVGPMTLINRARLALERSLLLPFLGRSREVHDAAGEARRIGSMLGHDWLVAWSYWSEIVAASLRYDARQVEHLLDEFEATGFIVMNDFTQSMMWCEVAECLGRVGLFTRAHEVLGRARQSEESVPWYIEYVDCTLGARDGDPAHALDRLETLALHNEVDPTRRWRIDLFQSYCHWRLGRSEECAKLLGSAVDRATELGQASLPDIVEGRLVASMHDTHPSPVAQFGPIVEISLFDAFEVRVNGQSTPITKGHQSNLVKLLVLHGGRATLDQVIDPLWPDANLEQGRKRIRNVLNRVKEACGPIIERDGDQLVLAGVSSDYERALERAAEALSPGASPESVHKAIQANDRPLLPTDRYEDWAERAGQQHRERLIELFDAQASLAEAAGDIDLTVNALRRADALHDFRTTRLETAADLLRRAGRAAAASALTD